MQNIPKKINIIIKYIKLFVCIFKYSFINALEYKFNFFFGGLFELAWMVMYIIFFEVIFQNTEAIAGWTRYEMIMLIILTGLSDAILTCLFNEGIGYIPQSINQGTLDFILLKPVNKQFYLSFRKITFPQIYNIVLCITALSYLIAKISVKITLKNLLIAIVLYINGLVIMYCVFFLLMTMSFWVIKLDVVFGLFPQIFTIGNKPINIYPRIIQKIFVYIIPIFVAYSYPAMCITKGLKLYDIATSFVVTIIFFILTKFIFKKGLQRYYSASS